MSEEFEDDGLEDDEENSFGELSEVLENPDDKDIGELLEDKNDKKDIVQDEKKPSSSDNKKEIMDKEKIDIENLNLEKFEKIIENFLINTKTIIKESETISEKSLKEKDNLSTLKKSIDELINKANEITIEHNKAKNSLDKVLGDFEDELREMIHSIDTSFLLREVQKKITEVTKNIPVAELNAGAKGITKSLESLIDIYSGTKKMIEENISKQSELKQDLDDSIVKLSATADVIKSTKSKINIKENIYIAIIIGFSALLLGGTMGFFYGIYSSQNFIGVYLSNLNKNINTFTIEQAKNVNEKQLEFEKHYKNFKKDERGVYILLDRKGNFLEEKNSDFIRYYFNIKE